MADLAEARARERSITEENLRLGEETARVDQAIVMAGLERQQLAVLLTAANQEIDVRRQALDDRSRLAVDLSMQIDDARRRLEQARMAQPPAPPPMAPIAVQNYPTPISQTVHQKELHFRLLGGEITAVPLDPLVELLKADAQVKIGRLRDLDEFSDTVGPVGGFRLRYTLMKVTVATERAELLVGGSFAQLAGFTLEPTGDEPSEPLADALSAGSALEKALARINPKKTVITVWVYPDSFAEFRTLKESLFGRGYSVACRPLPAGFPIGGSPQGSKSYSQ